MSDDQDKIAKAKECRYFLCTETATIKVPRSGDSFCDAHYMRNVAMFGCDLKGEVIGSEA